MGVFVSVKSKTLERRLKGINRIVTSGARKCVARSAMSVERRAKKREARPRYKVRTGRLRSSIRTIYSNRGLAATVGTNVEYAAFVEFGTGRRGAATNRQRLPSGYNHGSSPGSRAFPYLGPAARKEIPRFRRCIRDLLRRGFKKGGI